MKIFNKILLFLLIACLSVSAFVACGDQIEDTEGGDELAPWVDYASQVKLDRSSGTLQIEATVKSFIDGDTTHFYVDRSVCEDGVLKARYLAINTPESQTFQKT